MSLKNIRCNEMMQIPHSNFIFLLYTSNAVFDIKDLKCTTNFILLLKKRRYLGSVCEFKGAPEGQALSDPRVAQIFPYCSNQEKENEIVVTTNGTYS